MNREGFRPPKRRERFNGAAIKEIILRHGFEKTRKTARKPTCGRDEWLLGDLARHLDMPATTLYSWIGKGWLKVRKEPGSQRRLLVWADARELESLRERRSRPNGFYARLNFVTKSNRSMETPEIKEG